MIHRLFKGIIILILNIYDSKKIEKNLNFIKTIVDYGNSLLGRGSWGIGPREEVEKLKYFLPRDIDIVIDVGAHNGQFSDNIISEFNFNNLYMLEPSKTCYENLLEKFNNLENIHIFNFGLSDKEETAIFYGEFPGDSHSGVYKRKLRHFEKNYSEVERVNLKTFDEFWKNTLQNKEIDLLKVDVEGHELAALKGATESLKSIKVIQFEFGGTSIDSRTFFQDFFYLFKDNDFTIYRMRPNGLLKIDKYTEQDEHFSYSNFLAVNNKIS